MGFWFFSAGGKFYLLVARAEWFATWRHVIIAGCCSSVLLYVLLCSFMFPFLDSRCLCVRGYLAGTLLNRTFSQCFSAPVFCSMPSYGFAIAGINLTSLLLELFESNDLQRHLYREITDRPVVLDDFHDVFCKSWSVCRRWNSLLS